MSITFGELLDKPYKEAQEYISGGVLGYGQVLLLAAPAATFKSVVGLNICHALASGTKVFGKLEVKKPVKVSLFDKEVGAYYLQKRLRLFYGNGEKPPPLARISAPSDEETDFSLDNKLSLDVFRREIEKTQPQVVILDCLNPFLVGDEKEETYARVAKNVEQIQKEFKQLNLSFIILHHMAQIGMGQDPLALSNVRGHGKIVDWPATRVLMARKKVNPALGLEAKLQTRWVFRHAPMMEMDLDVKKSLRVEVPDMGILNL